MDSTQDRRDYLQQAYSWSNTHLRETIRATYTGEKKEALAGLEQAQASLVSSGLPADLQDMLSVRIRYLRWQVQRIGEPEAVIAQLRAELIRELQSCSGTAYAMGTARGYLIQLRTIDLRDHGIPYSADDFHADLDAVVPELHTKELCTYISTWGFIHCDTALVEECYSIFLTEADGFLSDYTWQRVNLMNLLLSKSAEPRDVIELLRRFEHANQWHDFEHLLLPVCIQCGLLDDNAVCAALGSTMRELFNTKPQMPKRLRSTGRIRGS